MSFKTRKMIRLTIFPIKKQDKWIARWRGRLIVSGNSRISSYFNNCSILPVFQTGDLKKSNKTHSYMDKAIKKGSIVIQRHSMKIKGKEHCKWIDDNYFLVGKAYFYKGEFDEAIKTFGFIKNEYKRNEIRFETSLWLIRSYVEKQEFTNACTSAIGDIRASFPY